MHERSAKFWDDVATLFSEAMELGTVECRTLLERRCDGRADLRAEVESLLAAHRRADRFMVHPTFVRDAPGPAALRAGEIVGQFRLVERIASGGMGTVYQAERADGSFEQRAAVKIIAAPIEREDVRDRFLAERQILASLHHPHIVTLLDGGLTPQGQAYLIMEFVDGVPITAYCRQRALGIDARLRLFRQVCDAVQHAHAHFVVHSDLKPANVLVTSDGVPKVLDFGIATLLKSPRLPSAPSQTVAHSSDPLTPSYASPEQLQGLPVTIASDVYALGILLFELLAGTRPYDVAGKPVAEVVRAIEAASAARPSDATPTAEAAPPYDWRRRLRGDLDAIAMRACHRIPEQRYASADALSQDIERYLSGVPVSAQKATFGYVLGKLATRHRVAFASAGLSAALVLASLGAAMWQAHVARVERQRAVGRFNEVRALANAVIFKIHDAVAPLPGSTPVRRLIVDEGLTYLERITAEAAGDPDLELELGRAYVKIGVVQGRPNSANLGDREGAAVSLRKAKALLAPLARRPGASAAVFRSYLDAVRYLSETLMAMGGPHHAEAIAEAQEAVEAAQQFAARHPSLDEATYFLGTAEFALAHVGGPDELSHWEKAGAAYGALLAKSPADAVSQRNVALVEKYQAGFLEGLGDYATSLLHYERALDLDQKRLDRTPDDRVAQFDVAIDLSTVAFNRWRTHDLDAAIELYMRSLKMREQLSATDPTDALSREKVAYIHGQLGSLYQERGDAKAALEHLAKEIDIYTRSGFTTAEARRNAADGWTTVASLEGTAAHAQASCNAFRKAFELYEQLAPADRSVSHPPVDPLPEVAQSAARCGHAAAQQWLRSAPPH
jgi:eukaryotic-like serine/threonine-protein kinase